MNCGLLSVRKRFSSMTKMTSFIATLPVLFFCLFLVAGTEGAGVLKKLAGILSRLPSDYVEHPDIGKAYKIHDGSFTWTEAKDRCVSEGAQLAVIDSDKKLEYALRKPQGDGVRHVGIHQVDGKWVSVSNGATVSSIPWKEGEPRLVRFSTDHCAMIDWTVSSRRIVSGLCNEYHGDFVCELPIPAAV